MAPTQQVQTGVTRILEEVVSALLVRLQIKDPELLEETVVKLQLAMGYCGGSTTQLTDDGGIDGVIDQDLPGLNRAYT